jgi:ubiquinone/menaquinone biosynthesis C-methylase UbiE
MTRLDRAQKEKGMTSTLTLDALAAVKEKQQATWASGDYAVIGTTLQIIGELVAESVDVSAGERVLDVAAGNGNASLAAARRGADVVATDYVESLLERAKRRADADGLPLTTEVADAEDLPYDDGSFDVVLSTLGVMFTPNPERAAAELLRVVRPGGRIGLANWTPEGFIGQMFKVVGAHVPPPAGVPSPLQWGTEGRIQELLGDEAKVETERKHFTFRYRSAEDFFETFKTYYGPTFKAWGALDADAQQSFRGQLIALANRHDRNQGGALTIDSEYLEVVAIRH